jgi:hypothetical protein
VARTASVRKRRIVASVPGDRSDDPPDAETGLCVRHHNGVREQAPRRIRLFIFGGPACIQLALDAACPRDTRRVQPSVRPLPVQPLTGPSASPPTRRSRSASTSSPQGSDLLAGSIPIKPPWNATNAPPRYAAPRPRARFSWTRSAWYPIVHR